MSDATGETATLDDLTQAEARVLGCLIEKEATTPDNYPLTLNSLRNACNQSTSRSPVVDYDDFTVDAALTSLRQRGLTRTVHSTSNRAAKFRHVAPEVLELDHRQLAVIGVLLLRGPQTVGELKSRTERQHRFASTEEVSDTLTELAGREAPLTLQLERQPGQKDARWVHLMTPLVVMASGESAAAPTPQAGGEFDVGRSDVGPGIDDAVISEFADLFAVDVFDALGLELLDLLADVDPSGGPIVEITGGGGMMLSAYRAAVPGASVLVIQPSAVARAAVYSRLATDGALRAATTVDPRPLALATLPPSVAMVVAPGGIGGLDDADHEALWRLLDATGAPAAIAAAASIPTSAVAEHRVAQVKVGERSVEAWRSGDPVGELMLWTVKYRVLEDDASTAEPLAEHVATLVERPADAETIERIAAAHGRQSVRREGWVMLSGAEPTGDATFRR